MFALALSPSQAFWKSAKTETFPELKIECIHNLYSKQCYFILNEATNSRRTEHPPARSRAQQKVLLALFVMHSSQCIATVKIFGLVYRCWKHLWNLSSQVTEFLLSKNKQRFLKVYQITKCFRLSQLITLRQQETPGAIFQKKPASILALSTWQLGWKQN